MLSKISTDLVDKYFLELGLTLEHSKVYLSALNLGTAPASQIARRAELPRSSTYYLIEELISFGLISVIKEETKKVFSVTSPNQLLFLLEQKQSSVSEKLNDLKENIHHLQSEFLAHQPVLPKVRFHTGKFGLKTAYYDCLGASEVLIICQGSSLIQNGIENDPQYLKDFIKETRLRKLKTREIIENTRSGREYAQKFNSRKNQILIIPQNPKTNFGHVDKHIYGNKVTYISHDNLTAVIIEDETIASHERAQFETLWKLNHNKGK